MPLQFAGVPRRTLAVSTVLLALVGALALPDRVASAGVDVSGPAVTAAASPAVTSSPAAAVSPQSVFDDEFTGPAGAAPAPSTWAAEVGGNGWGNNELEYYTGRTKNAALDGAGHLAIRAYRETYTGADGVTRGYTSARLISKSAVQYGAISARILVPSGQGLWPAFWTLGADMGTVGWPQCGEIDVMEALNAMTTVYGTVHGPDGAQPWTAYGIGGTTQPAGGVGNSWHTYTVRWSRNSVTWYVDWHAFRTVTAAELPAADRWEFTKPHRLLLDLAVGGWPGAPNSSTFAPGPRTMLVDWVRVAAL